MPSPILANPAAYLRALNAPPSLGPYSAMTSTPYMMGGIGVGPGNQMISKDQAGIDAAARAWAAAMAQQQAAGPSYAGMVFGDSPGQASQMAIGLRNQRAAEAAAAAARAQDAQKFLIQQEALRQANLLDAQIKMAQVQEYAAVRRDATEQRREASREQMLTKLLGGSGSGSGSGTAGPGIDVTSLLQDKEKIRTLGANLEAQQQAISNQMFLAAKQAAEQFPGYTVSPGQGTNPYPTVRYVGDPNTQSVEAARAIQAAMLGQSAKPTGQWTDDDWSQWLNTGVEPTAGAPTFLNQLQNLQAQQAAAKANLASLSDVFAARKDLAGPKQGPNPQVLQALLQYLNPAPTQVPSRLVPPPYALLDNRTAPVVLNNPRPAPTPEQIAWYGQRAALFPNAPGQAPVLPGGLAPTPTPVPGPLTMADLVQGPITMPAPVAPALSAPPPIQYAYSGGKLVPTVPTGAPPASMASTIGTKVDKAISKMLGVAADLVKMNRQAYLLEVQRLFGQSGVQKVLGQ